MLKKKMQDEPEKHDRWLITYADMITLLLVLFVMLYAISQIDVSKYEALRISLFNEFSTPTIINLNQPAPPSNQEGFELGKSNPLEDEMIQAGRPGQTGYDTLPGTAETDQRTGETGQGTGGNMTLDQFYQQIEGFIQENQLQEKITLTDDPRGISIAIQEVLLFDTGSAEMKEEGVPYLTTIAEMLTSVPNDISIEGHTDIRPIHNAQFPSNWELSTARALTVLHFLTDQGVQPQRLKVVGYGEYHPVDPENLSRNRRVDIIILRNSATN